MGVATWRIWQVGIFKSLGFMFSAPTTVLDAFIVREEGTLGLEKLPLSTGYIKSVKAKKAWHALHNLKVKLQGRELPVLPISERSRIPLDPYNLSTDDKNLESLEDIALAQYTIAFSRLKDKKAESENAKMARTALYLVVILGLVVFIMPNLFSC
ncbi:MAG: hypothetical protein IMZ53_16545 [Thermoplasmata archaeon]|nr:hypothetical protein [Thermoplasmata archaeon]